MPTARAYSFLVAALLFYFFANQTQVGWLYVISALLLGLLLAGFILNRRTMRAIRPTRNLSQTVDLHEGDDLTVQFMLHNQRRLPEVQLRVIDCCPLAAPDDAARQLKMFVPVLDTHIAFDYDVTIYRRGLHTFPPVLLKTRAPFGFFQRETTHNLQTQVLVYPLVRELSQFALLDRQFAAEMTNPRAGRGSEVIGVRPYRAGDSQRHIHWRSVARRGELISKEFAEETRPGVILVLDRYQPFDDDHDNKHTPFEIAVKCAASIADYALRQNYPVYLAADAEDHAVPRGAVVRDSVMQYLARVTYRKTATLADVLTHQPMQQFIVVSLSYPDEHLLQPLRTLAHSGKRLLVILPDPASYPIDDPTPAEPFADQLQALDIPARLIRHGDDWAAVISDDAALTPSRR